jgi:branched-chain amino acid transport system ATP-binding protein
MTRSALVARQVQMQFGGVRALDNASVTVRAGGIVGLIGRNGSGKSTLFNCITGFLSPDGGTVMVDEQPITRLPPHTIVRRGVARTFQTPRVDLQVTVFEAVRIGFFTTYRSSFLGSLIAHRAARSEEHAISARADRLLIRLGLDDVRDTEMGRLSMGRIRLVEVARSMAAGARYLLLDEPAAGLSPAEINRLVQQIRAVAETGIGVLLVEHNFPLIEQLCERVTVLENGRVLYDGLTSEVRSDPQVIESYLGLAAIEKGRKP